MTIRCKSALALLALAAVVSCGSSEENGSGSDAGSCGPMPGAVDCLTCEGGLTSPVCTADGWECPEIDCGPCGISPGPCDNPCTLQQSEPVCEGETWTCPTPACTPRWSQAFAGGHPGGLAVGAGGRIAISGMFMDAIDLGQGEHTAQGERDTFVASFDVDGALLWSKTFGGTGRVEASSLAMTQTGELAVCGMLDGSVSFGTTTLTSQGRPDQFVALLSSEGQPIWAQRFHARHCTIEAENDGELVLAGYFGDSIDPDPFDLADPARPSSGDADIYVTKLSASGAHVWTQTYAGDAYDYARDMTLGADGNISVVGAFRGGLDLGAGALPHVAGFDAFALTLDRDGAYVSSFSFGGPGFDDASGVAPDPEGGLLITSSFTDSIELGGQTFTASGSDASDPDGLFVRAAVDGQGATATRVGGVTNEISSYERWQVCSHPDGAWAIGGGFVDALEIGDVTIPSMGSYDIGIATETTDGWSAYRRGEQASDLVSEMAVSPATKQLVVLATSGGTMLLMEIPIP